MLKCAEVMSSVSTGRHVANQGLVAVLEFHPEIYTLAVFLMSPPPRFIDQRAQFLLPTDDVI